MNLDKLASRTAAVLVTVLVAFVFIIWSITS